MRKQKIKTFLKINPFQKFIVILKYKQQREKMKVNLNTISYNTFRAASPPPIPNSAKTTAKKFSVNDWEEFFLHYWMHFASDNSHLIKDVSEKTSLGLKTVRERIQLSNHARKY
jgi:hypothetical protein